MKTETKIDYTRLARIIDRMREEMDSLHCSEVTIGEVDGVHISIRMDRDNDTTPTAGDRCIH